MRRGFILIILLSVFALTISGCDRLSGLFGKKGSGNVRPREEIKGTVLAKINSSVITLEDFNNRIDNFNQMSDDVKIDTFDKKKSFLQTLVQQDLFFQHAASKGLDKDLEIDKAIKEFHKGLTVQKLLSEELTGVGVEAEEIENFYNLTKANYRIPPSIKASEIVISSKETARQVLIELLKGSDFAAFAKQYSKAPSAKNGGQLGWIKQGDRKVDRFDEFAFSLDKGEVSNVFKTPEGYFLVKVEDKKGGELKPISEVWDEVRGELLNFKQNQKIVDMERNLRTTANIELHEELLR